MNTTEILRTHRNQVRNRSTHAGLRVAIEWLALLGVLGAIGNPVLLFMTGHPWLAVYSLVGILAVVVLRNLATLIVDIADLLLEQATAPKPASPETDG
ncbi:MAG: hypothetical protein H7A47_01550 [Verrucomicrobiales bacterium]|nr:hypothetical protein [Verrucomicrobiales bacterium]